MTDGGSFSRRRLVATLGTTGAVGLGAFGYAWHRNSRSVYYASPDGSDLNPGSRNRPLSSIQSALDMAGPGDTVHALPGEYYESVETRRPGEPDAPITITGPPEATVRGDTDGYSAGFLVTHSHVHITGLTLDGLQDRSRPEEATSYMNIAIKTVPVDGVYLEGLVFTPHAVGNTRGALVNIDYAEDVEVGEFRVIGPAGVDYKLGERTGHFGEVVYVGSPVGSDYNAYDLVGEGEIGEVDETNGVHVHHVDASAGHYHIELVDVKAGCRDVCVEYCTSVDARLPNDNDNSSAVHVGGTDVRFRWNRIQSPAYNGLDVGNYGPYNDRIPHPDAPDAGTENSIYGNELLGAGAAAINYTEETSEAAQRVVCGNVVDTESDGNPSETCPATVPEGDGIGHMAGESPWA